MSNDRPAKKRADLTVGESARILREPPKLSRSVLAGLFGIAQATISAIENNHIYSGVERAKVLARALTCQPAVLVFSGWEVPLESAAQVSNGSMVDAVRPLWMGRWDRGGLQGAQSECALASERRTASREVTRLDLFLRGLASRDDELIASRIRASRMLASVRFRR